MALTHTTGARENISARFQSRLHDLTAKGNVKAKMKFTRRESVEQRTQHPRGLFVNLKSLRYEIHRYFVAGFFRDR